MKNNKRLLLVTWVFVWVAWLLLGVFNLWRGDISRFTYGCCWIVALVHIGLFYSEVWRDLKRLEREREMIMRLLDTQERVKAKVEKLKADTESH